MSGVKALDVVRAAELKKRAGMTFQRVGVLLAQEAGRSMPYTQNAVQRAVKKYNTEQGS